MKNEFKVHSDSGHSWLAVKRKALESLGVLDKISRFSYQKGATVYLEEDMDAGTFIEAYKAKYGRDIVQVFPKNQLARSPVRSYESFVA